MNQQLLNLNNTNNAQDIKDITDVKIDVTLPPKERMMNFLFQIKNPYRFKCQDIVVNVTFTNEDNTLPHLLIEYFIRRKESI